MRSRLTPLLVLIACGGDAATSPAPAEGTDQTLAEGLAVFCEGYKTCAPCNEGTPEARRAAFAAFLSDGITNPEALAIFDELERVPPKHKTAFLLEKAGAAGLQGCSFAQRLRVTAEPRPAGPAYRPQSDWAEGG